MEVHYRGVPYLVRGHEIKKGLDGMVHGQRFDISSHDIGGGAYR